jgi:hypothetical protein
MINSSPHSFHIPVLGLGFSIDTPLKVAKFGISSVVSIIEDGLIEDMRALHAAKNGLPYVRITEREDDFRAKRITAYLDTMQDIISRQVTEMKTMSILEGSELYDYFMLLPESSLLKKSFIEMLAMADGQEKQLLQRELRSLVVAGAIDVNIMAKVDNPKYTPAGERMPDEYSDALSALRGFANSKLSSSVVFSAGYNPRLYSYVEQFADFFPSADGSLRKRIILKVSDYRSALVQGKILAKKGIWISEFRIESGLNCGGHAFATDGLLMGPILEEFRGNRAALAEELLVLCNSALLSKDRTPFIQQPVQALSAQGGIGTAEEHRFLLEHFGLDSIGWGSPFLLVPEATNVDEGTLQELARAKKEDYYLSDASPLGVPFNNFRRSTSEAQRKARIAKNRAGSPCYKKYLSSNTEFTELPICTASRQYVALKERQLEGSGLSDQEVGLRMERIAEKDCLCEGLTSSVRLKNDMEIPHKLSAVAICPGPNLAYFSGVFTLKQMVGHIYGRCNLNNREPRPHMFINELELYISYLRKLLDSPGTTSVEKHIKYCTKFRDGLLQGISYYRSMEHLLPGCSTYLSALEHDVLALSPAELVA